MDGPHSDQEVECDWTAHSLLNLHDQIFGSRTTHCTIILADVWLMMALALSMPEDSRHNKCYRSQDLCKKSVFTSCKHVRAV
jgi:hypothetical protein